jgi:hypothetical protein
MAEDVVIETTNERGIVEQARVSANQTELDLRNRKLVGIDGVERATTLKKLQVTNQRNFRCRISRSLVVFVQLDKNCFVDMPACVLASTQLAILDVSLVRVLAFLVVLLTPFAALLEPLVLCARCHRSNESVDKTRSDNEN